MSVATLSRTSEGLRDVYGRGMNVHSDVYKLPADAEEHDRLTLQHRIWKLMFGGTGLYPLDVEDIIQRLLSSNRSGNNAEARSPAVLDLGSGSGIWAAEMAAMYPHAKVVGIDLAEPKLQKSLFRPNCSFVMTDLTKGLDAYRESFDVVHCRCVAGHVQDRIQLMREIAKVLKPGGLLILGDGNLHIYRPNGSHVPSVPSPSHPAFSPVSSPTYPESSSDDSEGSWTALWFKEVIGRLLAKTQDPDHAGGEHLGWLIRQEPELEYIGEKGYFSPLVSSRQEQTRDGEAKEEIEREREREDELAKLTGRNISNYLTASKPILLAAGLPQELVDDWLSRARAEIFEPNPEETWSMKWSTAWAVKRDLSKSESEQGQNDA